MLVIPDRDTVHAMSTLTFDTFRVVRDLETAGVERKQAEAHAETLRHAVTANREELATKGGISAVQADISGVRGEISSVKADVSAVKADPSGVRAELATIRWAIGLPAAFVFAIGLRVFGLL